MPPYLPWHYELVLVSGVFEILVVRRCSSRGFRFTRRAGLIALLVAVFPANLHMALNAEQYPNFPPALLWARLPLQGVLIAWAYWFTHRP